VATHRPVSIPISVTLRNGREVRRTAPILLPELHSISSVSTKSPLHWPVVLDFEKNPSHLAAFLKTQTIHVHKRSAHALTSSVFQGSLQALDDTLTSSLPTAPTVNSLNWIFSLPSFSHFDKAETALVLPPDAGNPVNVSMEGSVVDTRLVLEKASLDRGNADRLRNIRLLFKFVEMTEGEEGAVMKYLSEEVVDRLKAAVWMIGGE